jgi:aldehyde dehydrogenase (NAD+)
MTQSSATISSVTDLAASLALTIDGRAVAGAAAPLTVVNPATEAVLAHAPAADTAQLDEAVAAARTAFTTWRTHPWAERRQAVLAYADALEARAEDLARLLTAEQGKPLAAARGEVGRALEWARALAKMELPTRTAVDDEVHVARVRHVPIGVVAGIVPWNFPVTLAMWKIAPALLTGNTIVLKPSPFTPLTGLLLGAIARDILPAGVLNVITGDHDLGPALTEHPGIDKIAFTGSTATGRAVMQTAGRDLKRVTLELGGNDAAVILPDADVEAIAPQIFWACFANTSQYCLATKRVYVHADVHERLLNALIDYAATVVVGDGADEATQMGPLQNRAQYERVLALIAQSEAAGHTIAFRGTARGLGTGAGGAVRPDRARPHLHGHRRRPRPDQREPLRAGRLRLGHRRRGRRPGRGADRVRRRLGQRDPPALTAVPARGPPRLRHRPRERDRGSARVLQHAGHRRRTLRTPPCPRP